MGQTPYRHVIMSALWGCPTRRAGISMRLWVAFVTCARSPFVSTQSSSTQYFYILDDKSKSDGLHTPVTKRAEVIIYALKCATRSSQRRVCQQCRRHRISIAHYLL